MRREVGDTSRDEINALLRRATNGGVHRHLAWIDHPSASIDFNHSKFSAIVDGSQTRVSGKRMVNLLVWFDNEWAFVNRMLEIAAFWSQRLAGPSLVGGSR